MSRASGNSSGFSLVEVLAALFILGAAIAAAIGLISGSLKEIGKADDHVTATVHARSLLEEALAAKGVEGLEGPVNIEGGRFKAQREVSEFSSDGEVKLYEITVKVSWGRSSSVSLSSRKAVSEVD